MKVRPSQPGNRSRRGLALVLVMFAVASAVCLGLAFMSTSSQTTTMTTTAEEYYQARHVTESGLEIAGSYVRGEKNWRAKKAPGKWVSKHAIHGGRFDADTSFSDKITDPLVVTITGSYGNATHQLKATFETVIAGAWGVAVKDTISMSNTADVDSYDSSKGPYGLLNKGSNAGLTTNATYAGAVTMDNTSRIWGDVRIGAGGIPSTTVAKSGSAVITGTVSAQPANIVFPSPPTPPTGLGSNLGSKTFASGTTVINSNRQYDDLIIDGSAIVRITGSVTILVNKSLTVGNAAQLIVDAGSKLTLYVREDIQIKNSAVVNPSGDTQRVLVYGLGSGYLYEVQNIATFCGVIDAPNSSLKVHNHAQYFGVFMGKSIELTNTAFFHVDTNPALVGLNPRLAAIPGATTLRMVSED